MNKHIAIIGAGFAGIATAWYLLKNQNKVTLFDNSGIGGGASGISAGLLHTYVGAHAKINWKGKEGLNETLKLLNVAEAEIGNPIKTDKGLLRIAMTDKQKEDYFITASRYPDVQKLNIQDVQNIHSNIALRPGILIQSGMSVYTDLYLEGLWKSCQKMGAQLEQKIIDNLSQLKNFDTIVVTTGALTTSIPEFQHLPIRALKGQIIQIKWPDHLPPLPLPISSQVYLVMSQDKKSFFAGATFERTFHSAEPDINFATEIIIPKVKELLPDIGEFEILDCKSGLRATTPNQRPFVKQVSPNCFVFAGLGSKGLLYHALFAKELTRTII